jgi:hypothetical protein
MYVFMTSAVVGVISFKPQQLYSSGKEPPVPIGDEAGFSIKVLND